MGDLPLPERYLGFFFSSCAMRLSVRDAAGSRRQGLEGSRENSEKVLCTEV